MELQKLIEGLHPLERAVLPHLKTCTSEKELTQAVKLQQVEVVRALQWLEAKGALTLTKKTVEHVTLGDNGKKAVEFGLPEKRFLNAVSKKPIPLSDLAQQARLDPAEVNICLGLLKRKQHITFDKGVVSITEEGKKHLTTPSLEEQFLLKLSKGHVLVLGLSAEEKYALEQLRTRKQLVELKSVQEFTFALTELGKKLSSQKISTVDMLDTLTVQALRSGEWKNKTFRRYDVALESPLLHAGKKQPYRAFLDWVRAKFVSLGFEEMNGPLVETELWNMDALYMPQFHSARDIHDAYYIKEPIYGKLDPALVKAVTSAHEHGGKTGSTGWKYSFDVQRTHRHVLRTQGTACSSRKLASKPPLPGKYFGITRVFRHDVIDATHLPDFNQTEGIILGENLNFRHLIDLLKLFAREFAETDDIRLVPGYFPFTEPSVELYAKHPQLGWVELGGAGIFRPEVVEPLYGKNVSVLAWGLGIDRLGMFKLGFKDIRHLFSQDLTFLRETPVI